MLVELLNVIKMHGEHNVKFNILVVYLHTKLTVKGVLKDL
jgi:hypothetical protein